MSVVDPSPGAQHRSQQVEVSVNGPPPAGRQRPLEFGDPRHLAACRFLVEEALALDDRDFEAWLGMLSPDVVYQVRVRATTTRGGIGERTPLVEHYHEDLYSLRKRVARLATSFAWAEDPPSRTRHVVTNICTFPTQREDTLRVRSYQLVFRSRGDLYEPDLLCGERTDLLSSSNGSDFRLARREASVDESVLRTQNLAIFL
jgi:phthalate 3,4-dioxygenase beta subunit